MTDRADFTKYSETMFEDIVEMLYNSGTNMMVGNCNYLTHRILTENMDLDSLITDCGYNKLVPIKVREGILQYLSKIQQTKEK